MNAIKQYTLYLLLLVFSLASIAERKETFTYIISDHLGSPIMATDEQGEVLWKKDYRPYGETETSDSQNDKIDHVDE